MSRRSHWYTTAARAVGEAIDALPAGASDADVRGAILKAYPFGVRQHWPYKQWLKARRDALIGMGRGHLVGYRTKEPAAEGGQLDLFAAAAGGGAS